MGYLGTKPANSPLTSELIPDGMIGTSDLANGAVTQDKLSTYIAPKGTPAFSAYFTTNQSISNTTFTKVAFNTESFDTSSCYDTSTYRFTPNVAGYYQVNITVRPNASSSSVVQIGSLYVNGVERLRSDNRVTSTTGVTCNLSTIIYLDGIDDYIEAYGYISGTGTLTINGGTSGPYSNFSAYLLRSA
jgi:hypothetical protein